MISRVTTDIDAVQTFIVSGLISVLVDVLTLVGMIVVMFYVKWQFTLVALAVVPILFLIVYTYTNRVNRASREVRKHEGRLLSVVQEVLGSIRVVKAFARENYEIQRFEGESLETVEAALKARTLKARLLPLVKIVTAVDVCAILYFGGSSALRNGLTAGSIVLFLSYISDPEFVKLLNEKISQGLDVRVIGQSSVGGRLLPICTMPTRLHARAILRDGSSGFLGSQSLRKLELEQAPSRARFKPTTDIAQLEDRRRALRQIIVAARPNAKRGDLITPPVGDLFRNLMTQAMNGLDGSKVRRSLQGGEPDAVAEAAQIAVNRGYPNQNGQPLQSAPATLLQCLPVLPEGLEYRMVGSILVLRDTDVNLAVDYLPNGHK